MAQDQGVNATLRQYIEGILLSSPDESKLLQYFLFVEYRELELHADAMGCVYLLL